MKLEKEIQKLRNVDLEFIYEEVFPKGQDEEEAKEMDNVSHHLAKILIKRKGVIIKVIEPMLYNTEFVCGDESEDDFGTLNVYIPDKEEIKKFLKQ